MKYDESKQYGFTDENVNGSEEWMGFSLVFVDQVGRFSEDKSLNAENKKQALLDAAARGDISFVMMLM